MSNRIRMKTEEQLESVLVLPTRVLIIIERDMAEHISKICFEHEVDILSKIHGSVKIIDDPLEHQILIAAPDVIEQTQAEVRKAVKERKKINVLYMHHDRPHTQDEDGKWIPQPVFAGDEMNRMRHCYGVKEGTQDFYADLAYPHLGLFIAAAGGEYVEPAPGKAKNAA